MLEGADASQLDEWVAYSLLEPFGHTDRLLALIACRLFNMFKGEGEESIELGSFIPMLPEEPGDGLTDEERERQSVLRRELEKLHKKG